MLPNQNNELIYFLYHQYGAYIYSFCLSRLKNHDLAMDCLQEVFYTAIKKLAESDEKEIDPNKNYKAWLLAISAYTVKSFLKKHAILSKHVEFMGDIPDIPDTTDDYDKVIDAIDSSRVDVQQIEADIKNNLSDREYKLYKERFVEKLTPKEISEKHNISYTAVTTRINRVKAKITKHIKKFFVFL